MDLLSRLIAGSAATSLSKQKPNTSTERLKLCKRICGSLQHIWRDGTKLSHNDSVSNHVANLLDRLNTILHEESRQAAPHSCLVYTASAQVYIVVAKLTLSSDNPGVVHAARQLFHLLINGEAEGVLDSKIFARSLVELVRRSTSTATIIVDEKGEADLIELLFEIATKIRLDPDILPAWFYPERDQSHSRTRGSETRRDQFPLFYMLVEYVHHDGPMGDFARTGLLYLTDMASRSKPLEKWMIESDLAPQMASGLSALYSRLSRQAHVLTDEEKAIPLVALSDVIAIEIQLDETPEEFQRHIRSFLSYLAFWQDTLNHCKSEEVKDTLLDHFQVLFVQQLLYPSLLESSDVAGGSTSAVILHLCRMLEALENPEMSRRMLGYLLAASKQKLKEQQQDYRRRRVSLSRRKSMEQLASMAELASAPSPNLFNLLDLITISLRSKQSQTVNASLKLVAVILRRHHQHVLTNLFRTRPLADSDVIQSVPDLDRAMLELFDLGARIAQVDSLDESYQCALDDAQFLLQGHSCMLYASRECPSQRQSLSTDCKLFDALMSLLRSFFTNDSITNITLTETIMGLAVCEHIVAQDWICAGTEDDLSHSRNDLLSVFGELVEQLQQWKIRFPEWTALFVYQRSRILSIDAHADPTQARSRSRVTHSGHASRAGSPKADQRTSTPISTPVRSSAARGRKNAPPASFASIDGTLTKSPDLGMTDGTTKVAAGSPLHQSLFARGNIENTSATSTSTVLSTASLAQLQQCVSLSKGEDKYEAEIEHGDEDEDETEATSGQKSPSQVQPKLEDDRVSGLKWPKVRAHGSPGTVAASEQGEEDDLNRTSASLSHIMTNAVILQEFILEIAAVLQIRATLFDEVNLL